LAAVWTCPVGPQGFAILSTATHLSLLLDSPVGRKANHELCRLGKRPLSPLFCNNMVAPLPPGHLYGPLYHALAFVARSTPRLPVTESSLVEF
ncbi:hypothetical protein CP533_4897, partial [Ophiocordyceps camponoti-saundersi (nom. inval.)]